MPYSQNIIYPEALKKGDQIRVLALSRSIAGIMQQGSVTDKEIEYAKARLNTYGFKVTFGEHVMDCNEHLTADIPARLDDLHRAFEDPDVKAILTVSGGVGAMQIIAGIDYNLIKEHPKSICGYSDVTVILNAIFAKTGVVNYYGPNFSSFMMTKGFDYTKDSFLNQMFSQKPFIAAPSSTWSEDNWTKDQENRNFKPNDGYWVINEGEGKGQVIGGTYSITKLQGSPYLPSLQDAILFLECPGLGPASLLDLDSHIRALTYQKDFSGVKGIVLGRYTSNSYITHENLTGIFKTIPEVSNIPILANVDFGHTTPAMTIPIGGMCRLGVQKKKTCIKFRQE